MWFPAAFCLYFMQARMDWVLIILGTQDYHCCSYYLWYKLEYLSVSYYYDWTTVAVLFMIKAAVKLRPLSYTKNSFLWSIQEKCFKGGAHAKCSTIQLWREEWRLFYCLAEKERYRIGRPRSKTCPRRHTLFERL